MKKSLFSTLLIGIIVMTYFRKICHNIVFENKNAQIFALSHRNGAVDGWVYAYIFKSFDNYQGCFLHLHFDYLNFQYK